MTITRTFDIGERKETARKVAAFLGSCMTICDAAQLPVLGGKDAETYVDYVYHDEQDIRACYMVKLKYIALFHLWWLTHRSLNCERINAIFTASDQYKSGFKLKLEPVGTNWCECLSQVRNGYIMEERDFT